MTLREAFQRGEELLTEAGITDARLDAWYLLEHVSGVGRAMYYAMPDKILTEVQEKQYIDFIEKRAQRIPLQHLTGTQEFMGLEFRVNEHVLIPRQDTETLVEEALKVITPGMKVLDMCTGSGCILISILKNTVNVEGHGFDISKQALNVAKENARLNGVDASFERSDLFEMVTDVYDVIVSNPPYIPTEVIGGLQPEVAQYEPMQALDGKEDGLFFYRKIVKECRKYLTENGKILFEIGHDQGAAVAEMLTYAGFSEVKVVKDLAGNDRVVIGGL